MSNTSDHLIDIDFRTREVRQASSLEELTRWYLKLSYLQNTEGYDDFLQGQMTMLSSVLWYLLPANEYKKLTAMMKIETNPTIPL